MKTSAYKSCLLFCLGVLCFAACQPVIAEENELLAVFDTLSADENAFVVTEPVSEVESNPFSPIAAKPETAAGENEAAIADAQPDSAEKKETEEKSAGENATAAPSTDYGKQQLRLNFKSAPLSTVLDYLSEKAGLIVLCDTEISGRISVRSLQPVTVDEAVSLLNTVLKEKGYASVRQERVLRIVTLEQAKKENLPVQAGADPDAVTGGDDIITQVIPLNYVDVAKLKDDISPLLPTYAQLSANVSSNALIMTSTRSSIKRVLQIVKALDTAISGVSEIKVFPLEYADAEDTADLLNEIFETDSSSSSKNDTNPMARFFRMRGGPGGPPGMSSQTDSSSEKTQNEIKFKAAADERTNSVVVSAAPEILKVVEKMLEDLDDNPTGDQDVLVYKLKNADAENLEEVLTTLFEENDSNSTTSNVRGGPGSSGPGGGGPGGGGGGSSSSSSSSSSSGDDLRGEVDVVADTDTNSLLIMTATRNFERVRKIVDELDSPVKQILIKVLLAEVTHDDSTDIGLEFSTLNLASNDQSHQTYTDFGVESLTDGLSYRLVADDILGGDGVTAALNALKTVGKTEILSRPYILTNDNKEASITVGQEVPFITDSSTTDAGKTINTIEYEDIGIILTVTPHVNTDGLVVLDISPEISSISDSTVEISDTVSAPIFSKRYSESRVSVMDGKTIVIGGLMNNEDSSTEYKVPLLGDIPVLGRLFKRTVTAKAKKELLIFMTPYVVEDGSGLDLIKKKDELSLTQPAELVQDKEELMKTLEKFSLELKDK